MAEIKMPHSEHEQHLCLLQNIGYLNTNLEDDKKLVRNPNFVCKNCGRTAQVVKKPSVPLRNYNKAEEGFLKDVSKLSETSFFFSDYFSDYEQPRSTSLQTPQKGC